MTGDGDGERIRGNRLANPPADCGQPTRLAISAYVAVEPAGILHSACHTRSWKAVPRMSSGRSRPCAGASTMPLRQAHLCRLTSLARPKTSRLGLAARGMKADVLLQREPRRANVTAIHARCPHRIVERSIRSRIGRRMLRYLKARAGRKMRMRKPRESGAMPQLVTMSAGANDERWKERDADRTVSGRPTAMAERPLGTNWFAKWLGSGFG
jgi:hypothetical protein